MNQRDADIYLDETRFGMPRVCGPVRFGPRNMPGPTREDYSSGLSLVETIATMGDLRPPGGVASDPDAEVTSLDHFMATGQSWRPIQAWPNGADIQGGGL